MSGRSSKEVLLLSAVAALGLVGASLLVKNIMDSQPKGIVISQLHIFPIKGCAGIPVQRARITATGLENDRQWMLVGADSHRFVTQRQHGKMALITVQVDENARQLLVNAPGMEQLQVPLDNIAQERVQCNLWGSDELCLPESASASAWFSTFLEAPVRLVKLDAQHAPQVDPRYWTDEFPGTKATSFSDGYPFLLVSQESLDQLNATLHERGVQPLPMARFRPNIVVRNVTRGFEEDEWRTINIAGTTFHPSKLCSRCKVTTINPATGEVWAEDTQGQNVNSDAATAEPLFTLRQIHGSQDGRDAYFGQNLVHESVGGHISVGDNLSILDRWPAGKIPS